MSRRKFSTAVRRDCPVSLAYTCLRWKSILCTLKVVVTVSQHVRKLLVTILSFQPPFELKMRRKKHEFYEYSTT